MKKLYGIIGFAGFVLMLGAAGGAESVSFAETLWLMMSGLALFTLSFIFIKSHNMRMRRRRQLVIQAKRLKHESVLQYHSEKKCAREGIAAIVSGKINSPELC